MRKHTRTHIETNKKLIWQKENAKNGKNMIQLSEYAKNDAVIFVECFLLVSVWVCVRNGKIISVSIFVCAHVFVSSLHLKGISPNQKWHFCQFNGAFFTFICCALFLSFNLSLCGYPLVTSPPPSPFCRLIQFFFANFTDELQFDDWKIYTVEWRWCDRATNQPTKQTNSNT